MNIASKKATSSRDKVQPIASAGYSDYRKPVMNERNEGKLVLCLLLKFDLSFHVYYDVITKLMTS